MDMVDGWTERREVGMAMADGWKHQRWRPLMVDEWMDGCWLHVLVGIWQFEEVR